MRQPVKFLILLVAELALLTWGALQVVQETTVQRDLTLRARLAANGAAPALSEGYRSGKAATLRTVLGNLVRDERILGVSACSVDARLRSMRAFVAEFNIYRWAGRMLRDAARLRRRDRLSGRLSDRFAAHFPGAEA